jgi:tetratricopeptide (TPR) repeat protein
VRSIALKTTVPARVPALALALLLLAALAGCRQARPAAEQEAAARSLFNETVEKFHLPSARASGPARSALLEKAAAGYQRILDEFPDATNWDAQAMRSLANVRAEQGRLEDALKLYESVACSYPDENWEIVQSWKSAADLLWDANQLGGAQSFYQRIITKFDGTNESAVVKIIVTQSKRRVKEPPTP